MRDESRQFGKDVWAYRTLGGDARKAAGHVLTLGKNQIRLESGTEAFDQDGSIIAYVYVPITQLEKDMVSDNKVFFEKDGSYEVFLNAYLVKIGFAEVISMPADAEHQKLFLELETEAREAKRGMWA